MSYTSTDTYELQRLDALDRLGILDSEAEPEFDELVELAAAICGTPISLLSFIDDKRQWFKAAIGIAVPEMPLELTFCQYTIRQDDMLIVDDARDSGISAFRQLTQRFPSGREVPIEYTTVLLGGSAGMLAVGKSLLAVAELQSRFVAAQQTMERDYWKLREVETRYRLLFNHSSEAVVVIRAGTFVIEEANPPALEALGLGVAALDQAGRVEILPLISAAERPALRAMILRAQEQGKTPGIMIHLGDQGDPWLVRASAVKGEPGPMLMLQLVPAGARPADGDALIQHVAGQLSVHKRPREIRFVEALPRNRMGKVNKRELMG